MSSDRSPIEGLLAESGLRYLRNETEDTPEEDFSGSNIEFVPVSTGTAEGRGDIRITVVSGKTPATMSAGIKTFAGGRLHEIIGVVPPQVLINPSTVRITASGGTVITHNEPARGTVLHVPTSAWLDDAISEINSLSILEETKQDAEKVARLCAQLSLDEPLIDIDEHGNVELFFQSGSSGALVIVTAARNLQVFGNENGEKWRSQYDLNGRVWMRDLPGAMKAFALR